MKAITIARTDILFQWEGLLGIIVCWLFGTMVMIMGWTMGLMNSRETFVVTFDTYY
jgi:Tfp pilus assembly protein PilO